MAILLAFAFAISITAPRGWQRVAQRYELSPAKPLAARQAVAVAAASAESETTAAIEAPTPVRPAQPQERVAAEYAPALAAPQSVVPELRPATSPTVAVSTPATSVVLEPADVAEPPTLDRPRLSRGLLRPTTTGTPVVAAPVEPVAPQPAVAAIPELRPTPIAPQPSATPEAPTPATTPIVAPVVVRPSWWPEPVDLTLRLQTLVAHPVLQGWAEQTTDVLRRLTETSDLLAPEVAGLLGELRRATADSLAIDERRLDETTAVELRLTRHALVRRLDVWESLHAASQRETAAVEPPSVRGARQLELCLAELAVQTAAAGEVGRQWHDYLLLDALSGLPPTSCEDEAHRRLILDVLARLQRASASPEHREFLSRGPFAQLHEGLRLLIEEKLDAQRLLHELERFEQGGLPSDGREAARVWAELADSPDAARRKLGELLQLHYRNANVRITFAPDIVNRLLPDDLKRQMPVADTILGKETRGWSSSRTGLKVHFVPSDDRLTVRLSAEGNINAHTRTFSGPVRLFNSSNSAFRAEKEIELTTGGVNVKPAVASSQINTRLKAIESDFDGVPILGGIVAAIAHNQHDDKKPAAQREIAWKTANSVEKNLDDDLDRHLRQADAKLHERILDPLSELRIRAEIVDLQTSEACAAIRFRTAGDDQLAANTPRPRAYADNLASLQVHQSAVNNVIDRLGLQGRRFTLPELYAYVVERLRLPGRADVSQLPPDLELTFATTDPLTIRCENDRLELRMALDELRVGDRAWRNFVVRAPFRADVIAGNTYLLRDGVVRINGERLGTGSQISLRTVFAKVFPDDLKLKLWPDRLSEDPRFADLNVEQVDLRDGWIGVAVGPRHTAQSPKHETPAAPANAILPWLLRK